MRVIQTPISSTQYSLGASELRTYIYIEVFVNWVERL